MRRIDSQILPKQQQRVNGVGSIRPCSIRSRVCDLSFTSLLRYHQRVAKYQTKPDLGRQHDDLQDPENEADGAHEGLSKNKGVRSMSRPRTMTVTVSFAGVSRVH